MMKLFRPGMSQQHLLHEAGPQRYSDLAITTVLVIKRVFRADPARCAGFIDSIFTLMNVPVALPGLHQCQQARKVG